MYVRIVFMVNTAAASSSSQSRMLLMLRPSSIANLTSGQRAQNWLALVSGFFPAILRGGGELHRRVEEAAIAHDRGLVTRDRQRLTIAALRDYTQTSSGTSTGFSSLFDASASEGLQRTEYARLAAGALMTSVAALQNDQNRLTAAEAGLATRQSHDRQLASQQAALLAQSQSTQTKIFQQQAQISGQLAVAVAQQKSAEAAAASSAIRQAQKATLPTQSAATTPPSTTGASDGGATSDPALNPFLQCVVVHESGGNYGAVSPDGLYMGAFQFSQSTWNEAASLAGLPGLIGVPPNRASKASQDTLAVALYAVDGERPWYDPCRSA